MTSPDAAARTDPLTPLDQLAKGVWGWVLVRGILAILFGVIALIAPGIALYSIAIVFGAYALVDGVTEIIHAVQTRNSNTRWGWMLLQGVISVLAGLVALIFPAIAGTFGGLVALWTIVIYAITHGASVIATASGAHAGRAKTVGIVAGILSVVFGIILAIMTLLTPGATLIGLVWTVGIYAIVFGVMLIAVAFQLRRAPKPIVTRARAKGPKTGTTKTA